MCGRRGETCTRRTTNCRRLNTPADRQPASPRSYAATASARGLQGKQQSLANLEHSAILAPDTQTPVVCIHRIAGSAVENNHI